MRVIMKAKKYKNRLTDRICWTSVPFPAALRTEPIKFLFEIDCLCYNFTLRCHVAIPAPSASKVKAAMSHGQRVSDCESPIIAPGLGSLPVGGTPGKPCACAVTN